MKKIPKKGKIALFILVICLIGLTVEEFYSGAHTPQDCISEVAPMNFDPPDIKKKEKDIITVDLEGVTIYVYQSIHKDVRVLELKKQKILGTPKYSYIGAVTYQNKDWELLSIVPVEIRNKNYSYWFTKELLPEKESRKSYPVEVLGKNYYLNVLFDQSGDKED